MAVRYQRKTFFLHISIREDFDFIKELSIKFQKKNKAQPFQSKRLCFTFWDITNYSEKQMYLSYLGKVLH